MIRSGTKVIAWRKQDCFGKVRRIDGYGEDMRALIEWDVFDGVEQDEDSICTWVALEDLERKESR